MIKAFTKLKRLSILLPLILLVAFWFRIQGFMYGTFAFTYDVGRDFLAVSQMISSLKPLLIGFTTGLQGIFYGPTWYYLLSPFFLIFDGNPSGIVFVMVLTGVITAALGYLIGERTGGLLLGLIFSLLISVSQVMTEISAQIWNPNPIPMFVALALVVFLNIYHSAKANKVLFFVLGLILGIIFDLELVFGVLFTLSSVIYFSAAGIFGKNKIGILLFSAGFLLIQTPRIFFELRHDFLMSRTLIGSFVSQEGENLIVFVPRLSQTIEKFFHVWRDTIAWQSDVLGLVVLVFSSFVIVRTFKKISKVEKKTLGFVLVILTVFILGLSFFNHEIESHYYIGLPLLFIFIVSFALYSAKKYLRINALLAFAILFFLAVTLNQAKLLGTFAKSNWVGDASVYRNQVEVIDYIYQDANGEEFNTVTYTPPIHDYPYQYLFQWRGKNEYGYIPSKEYKKLFYLIIEPDLQFPIRQAEWLKIREGDGEILSEKEFESGIKVQKRIH